MEEHYSYCEKNDIISDNDIIIDELASTNINSSTESLTIETTRDSLCFRCPHCQSISDDDNHQDLCKYKAEPCKDCGQYIFINNPKKVLRHKEICNIQEE